MRGSKAAATGILVLSLRSLALFLSRHPPLSHLAGIWPNLTSILLPTFSLIIYHRTSPYNSHGQHVLDARGIACGHWHSIPSRRLSTLCILARGRSRAPAHQHCHPCASTATSFDRHPFGTDAPRKVSLAGTPVDPSPTSLWRSPVSPKPPRTVPSPSTRLFQDHGHQSHP